MKINGTLLMAGMVLGGVALSGQQSPSCGPVGPDVPVCSVPADCAALPGLNCEGSWNCLGGACVWQCDPCWSNWDCDDGNPCTDDECEATDMNCVHMFKKCFDDDPCTYDYCSDKDGSCKHDLVETCGNPPCDSNSACWTGSLCSNDYCDKSTGECVHEPTDCDDGDVCTADSCDASSGCVHWSLPGCP